MKKYLLFDEFGALAARYDEAFHGPGIPAGAVEVDGALFARTLREADGLWRRHPATAEIYKDPLPGPTLDEARAARAAAIRAEGARRLAALAAPYGPAERETWDTQQREARAHRADPAAPTPMLTAMAAGRGISLPELVDRVMGNVALFEAAAGAILGRQQALLDQLSAIDEATPDAVAMVATVAWE
ncbi:MAG: hypothetical protein A2Y38_07805 [Spirochaetes bacterium GWB1_59_5]|nr:MAG: hypothetical protein A2Y38_07805 [Spirochaetes bacterium GWB1_59_5]